MMKVRDVMSEHTVKFCSPETKLQDAAKSMKVNNCGALPVVNKDNKVMGIITDRDICLATAQTKSVPFENRKVEEVMSKQVHTVRSNDEISAAFQHMRKNQIGRLPVVDEAGKLKGIVSLHKLLNHSVTEEKKLLGNLSDSGENLLKTIQAVTDRYNNNRVIKTSERKLLKAAE
jgi:CBS-domain-containing membrane protein